MARNTISRGGGAPPAMPARSAGAPSRAGGSSFARGVGATPSRGLGTPAGGGHMCTPGQPCGAGLAPRGGASPLITVQPWTTVVGTSTTGDVIQPFDRWLNGEALAAYHLSVRIIESTQCTLVLESSARVEGPWSSIVTYTTEADTTILVSSEVASQKFSKYIRWRLQPNAAAWSTCFQIRGVRGNAAPNLLRTPRVA